MSKEQSNLEKKSKIIRSNLLWIVIVFAIFAGGIIYGNYAWRQNDDSWTRINLFRKLKQAIKKPLGNENIVGIKKFTSLDELKDFLSEQTANTNYRFTGRGMMLESDIAMPIADNTMAKSVNVGLGSTVDTTNQSADDFSTTNIQVAGVDEADIIKNDGEYIYAVSKKNLFIIKAFPAEKSEILTKIQFKSTPQDIYLNKNKLIVFGRDNNINFDKYPTRIRRSSYTFFKVFDISDKKNPKQLRDLDFEGNYYNSRMIGDYVYFITNNYSYYIDDVNPLPIIMSKGKVVDYKGMPNVYYFDMPYNSYNFTHLTAIDIKDNTKPVNSEIYLLNNDQNLFVSENNIYITYTKYIDEYQLQMEVMKEIVLPKLSTKNKERINEISSVPNYILNENEKIGKIAVILERYASSLNKEQQKSLEEQMNKAMRKKYQDIGKELEKTIIHKIAIDKDKLEYKGSGSVTGQVLNQFSMDEKDGYFRIATTKNRRWSSFDNSEFESYSNLFILDKDLHIVGAVEELAPGERIYSVRFMGNRAYMVTFKQTDPLFAIDLKNPTKPKVLGKLKIPGYSAYLHPYDENLLIGLGKDADEKGRVKGLKLSLFDVSDVANLKQIDSYEIGKRGSDSIALYDHKAFLFAKNKNLLVIPATIREETSKFKTNTIFRGALVFNIDKSGFKLKGKIDHWDGRLDNNMREYWYGYNYYDNTIKRSLYMDNWLYTFSNNYLKINNLSDLQEVKNLPLVKQKQEDYEIIN